jgi:hypothetical protein
VDGRGSSALDFARRRTGVRRAWSLAAKTEKTPRSGKVRSVPLALIGPLDRLSRREHFTDADDLVFCSPVGEHLDGGRPDAATRPL